MLCYDSTALGIIRIAQKYGGKTYRYDIQIRTGNCLCVMIHVRKLTLEELEENPQGKYHHTLYSFIVDERHAKNIMKDNGGKLLYDDVVSIKLNMFYKTSWKLLRLFLKSGYKVQCYWKEEETNK